MITRNSIAAAVLLSLVAPVAAAVAIEMTRDVVGMWVTADGRIRLELLANGRYDEARDGRPSVYTGSYRVEGESIHFIDDSGFTATGRIRDGVLTAGPDTFRRE